MLNTIIKIVLKKNLLILLNKLDGEYKLTFLFPCFCKNFN